MSGSQTAVPRRGEQAEAQIERLDRRGRGIGSLDGGIPVRVDGGVPGQRVLVQLQRRRRGTFDARALKVLDPGPHGVPARCPHHTDCGGCRFQEFAYAAQLTEKARLFGDMLAPLGDLWSGAGPHIDPIVGCENPWHYRNKMDFTFGNRRWVEAGEDPGHPEDFALGLHPSGVHSKVIDIARCDIAFEGAGPILASVRALVQAAGMLPWDQREHSGLMRHLVLRKGIATGEVMVDLVTSGADQEFAAIDRLAADLVAHHPEVTTVVHNVTDRAASVATGETERVLFGPGVIREELGGLSFVLSANSFFQTNTLQAERLIDAVRAGAALTGDEVVFDVCSGTGVLGLVLARDAREVWGFELVDAAVADARRNAEQNGVTGAHFIAGDVRTTLSDAGLVAKGVPAPDLCIVDPPRGGLHPVALGALRRLAPARIVYVSCNVQNAVPDMEALAIEGYRLFSARPIDLFPHTPHLEGVFVLCRG